MHCCLHAGRAIAVPDAAGSWAGQGGQHTWLGHPPAQLLVLLRLLCGVFCQAGGLHLLLQVNITCAEVVRLALSGCETQSSTGYTCLDWLHKLD